MVLVPESLVGEITQVTHNPIISAEERYYNELDQEMVNILNSNLSARNKLREFLRVLSRARQMKSSIPQPTIQVSNLPIPQQQTIAALPSRTTPSGPTPSGPTNLPQPPISPVLFSSSPLYGSTTSSRIAVDAEKRLDNMTARMEEYLALQQSERSKREILDSLKTSSTPRENSFKRKTNTTKQDRGDRFSNQQNNSIFREFRDNVSRLGGVYDQTTVPARTSYKETSLEQDDPSIVTFGFDEEKQGDDWRGATASKPVSPKKTRRYPVRNVQPPKRWKDL